MKTNNSVNKQSNKIKVIIPCPKCKSRLFDICNTDIKYQAVLKNMDGKQCGDFEIRCQKCKSLVGLTFARNMPLAQRRVSNLKDPLNFPVFITKLGLIDEFGRVLKNF